MTGALRRLLPEFDAPATSRPAPPAWMLLDRPSPPPHMVAVVPDLPADDRVPDPVAEAVAAALAQAQARHASDLAAAEARAATALADARARWAAETGQALATQVSQAAAAVADDIAGTVAGLLEPFLGEAIRGVAVADLRDAVADLVAGGSGGRIAICGPQDLLDALLAALASGGIGPDRLDLAASDGAEVVITADSSVVRTRLGHWMASLRERLDGGGEA